MRGTQSQELLQTYENTQPQLFCKPFSEERTKNLQDSVKKYSLQVQVEDKTIDQNYYTTRIEIKYYAWMIEKMENEPAQAKNLIDANLLQ
jgi:hypothetical protein